DTDEFYADIPESLRFRTKLNLPPPFLSEYALKRHVDSMLNRNTAAGEALSF
ncbi:MAG: aminomethyl-transferring glycine dehydrogenase, partial [Anaerolineae bacterium]|nr:aminomethyl-transferring glycine dehydrogenase [Anaerolineae bacterium]